MAILPSFTGQPMFWPVGSFQTCDTNKSATCFPEQWQGRHFDGVPFTQSKVGTFWSVAVTQVCAVWRQNFQILKNSGAENKLALVFAELRSRDPISK